MIGLYIVCVVCTVSVCLFLYKLTSAVKRVFSTMLNVYDSLEKMNITLRLANEKEKTEPVVQEKRKYTKKTVAKE